MKEHAFTRDEQAALKALVAQIIPASGTFNQPGADDPEILCDILTSGASLHPRLAAALAYLSDGTPVDAAKAEEFRRSFRVEAELIQTLTVQCYYRNTRVMSALNIDVRAPYPAGYTQETNDLSLLDPVRERGEIYRKTPQAHRSK
ncbi:hypothetical protein [Sulfitobacter sp.]|uniref:hypothetical protein n=1 Tax=Sulfitobacter sp. TaxID=1903071 RepID=UPI0030022095